MKTTDKLNLESISQRIKSKTPRFWKVVRRYMVALGVLGGSLMAAKMQYEMDWLSKEFCEYLITIGITGTALASITEGGEK